MSFPGVQEKVSHFLQENFPHIQWKILPWEKVTSLGAGAGVLPVLAPETLSQALEIVRKIYASGKKAVPIGGGFNFAGMDILEEDTFYLRISPEGEGGRILFEGDGRFRAGGAVTLKKLIDFALEYGYGGASALAGIPGTLGGALAMNAGARGREISEFLTSVTLLPLEKDPSFFTLSRKDLHFSYRKSPSIRGKALLWEAVFSFPEVKKDEESFLIQEELEKRKKNPKGRSAGSIFANPPGDSAGRLLEESGCKGMEEGAFFVSSEHANWILRKPGTPPLEGTFRDFSLLVEKMQKRVREKFNIDLIPEIRMPGKKE